MGGVILLFIVGLVVVILVTPALRERARKRMERDRDTVHEAVVRRLDDHRRRKGDGDKGKDGGAEG